jgi:hypothetical protein
MIWPRSARSARNTQSMARACCFVSHSFGYQHRAGISIPQGPHASSLLALDWTILAICGHDSIGRVCLLHGHVLQRMASSARGREVVSLLISEIGMSLSRRGWLPIVTAAAFLVLLWPHSYLASPRWDVTVVNDDGQPLRQANVRLVYQNYSVEANSHEIILQTNEYGRVLFPAQYQRTTLIQIGWYTAASALEGVHASFGRHAYVRAFGDYEGDALDGNYVYDWRGHPESVQSKIVGAKMIALRQ